MVDTWMGWKYVPARIQYCWKVFVSEELTQSLPAIVSRSNVGGGAASSLLTNEGGIITFHDMP